MKNKIAYNRLYTVLFDEANTAIDVSYRVLTIHMISHLVDRYAAEYRLYGSQALDELMEAYHFIKEG